MKKSLEKSVSSEASTGSGCCKIEHFVTVDERGQMVLPKELREKAGIRPGEKLALIGWEKDEKICCISLVKSGDFEPMVRSLLGPMIRGFI
jgi:antitoxin PrlF